MTFKTTQLRDAIVFALVVGAAAPGAALAQAQTGTQGQTQTQSQNPDAPQTLDNIVVTGTRILSQTVTSSSPVAEIQKEEFRYAGATRVEDLVNQYPQMAPSFDAFTNNGATGYASVDLRGLGSQRTLTLVNGYRLPEGAVVGARDISIVPAAAIKRTDILTGGASAVYGSDAIAGVVNFILDDEFEGVSLSAGYSAYQHKNDNSYIQSLEKARGFNAPNGNSGFGGVSRNIDLVVGSAFADGQGHAMAWATYRENDPLFQGERDYSACALNAAGTACGGSNTNAAGNFYALQLNAAGQQVAGTPASRGANGRFVANYGAPYNFAPINYYQRPDTRYTFGTSLKYQINEHFRPFLETMYVNHRSSTQVAESGAFFTPVPDLACTNPILGTFCSDLGLNPALPVTVYVAKRNVEGGPRRTDTETTQFRIVGGVEGELGEGWNYNVSYLYGHTAADSQGFNDFLSNRIVSGILGCPAGSFNGCLPYTVFSGTVTPQAAAALAGVSSNKTSTELFSLNAYVTGDTGFHLPWVADTAKLVMGVESREERYSSVSDTNSAEGNFAGAGGPSPPLAGKVSVDEIFLESALPLVRDAGFLKSLDMDLGYRLSDYDRSGRANTWKVGLAADLGGMVRLRSGFNHAIRAPNVAELFSVQQLALFTGSDPCAGPTPTATQAQCALTGVPAARYGTVPANSAGQYNQFIGGNPNLTPEVGNTFTFGVVATPIKNLQLSADYFNVKLENSITTVGANTILSQCFATGNPALCSLVRRNPISLDLFRGNDPATSGYVTNLIANFGERRFRGIDLGAFYRWDMLGGRFSTSFNGTYYLDQEIDPLPGISDAAKFDCVGRINTSCQSNKWRHIANVRYGRDLWSINLRWRYFDELDYVENNGVAGTTDKLLCKNVGTAATATCRGDGKLAAQNYFDLSGSINLGQATEITLGVNNIADKEPPLTGNTLATNGNAPAGYDQAGRYVFGTVTFRF